MEEDMDLPPGVCFACSETAMAAMRLRDLCQQSSYHWTNAVANLSIIDEPSANDKNYYIFYNCDMNYTVIRDQVSHASNKIEAVERLTRKRRPVKRRRTAKITKCRCPDCGKTFMVPYYLNEHIKSSMKRACRECGEVMRREKLAKHLAECHGKLVHDCTTCHKLFKTQDCLREHRKRDHDGRSEICNFCGCGFATARALRAHSYAHTLFLCPNCPSTFENRRCFKHHQKHCVSSTAKTDINKLDEASEMFTCDHCGKKYDKKPTLRIHIIQKHMNVLPFVCGTCGKRASTLPHLRSHETTHVLQRKLYHCHCGAKMRTELGFQMHQRIHTGEKPYECAECGLCFLSASRRIDHIKRRHRSTKDMPHGCEKCQARFVRPFELKKHYMSVHNVVVDVKPMNKRMGKEI